MGLGLKDIRGFRGIRVNDNEGSVQFLKLVGNMRRILNLVSDVVLHYRHFIGSGVLAV